MRFRLALLLGPLLIGLVYLFGLDYIPLLVVDEPFYIQTAYNLHSGVGLVGNGGSLFFLYPALLSLWLAIFPTTLWMCRLFSVVLMGVALKGMDQLGKHVGFSTTTRLLVMSVCGAHTFFYLLFRRARPEALVIALTIWGLLYWFRLHRSPSYRKSIIAGALFGLAAITHPYALAGLAAIGVESVIALYKKDVHYRYIALFWSILAAVGAVFFGILFFINGLSPSEIVGTLSHSGRASTHFLDHFTYFSNAYSMNGTRLPILLVELGLLGWGLVQIRSKQGHQLARLSVVYLMSALIVFSPFFRWGVGPILIGLLILWGLAWERGSVWIRVALVGYLLAQLAGNIWLISKHVNNTPYGEIEHFLSTKIPAHSTVLSRMELWLPMQKSLVIRQSLDWSRMAYPSPVLFATHVHISHIVTMDVSDDSPTLGKVHRLSRGVYGDYFSFLSEQTHRLGPPLHSLHTRGYGTIRVWVVE